MKTFVDDEDFAFGESVPGVQVQDEVVEVHRAGLGVDPAVEFFVVWAEAVVHVLWQLDSA